MSLVNIVVAQVNLQVGDIEGNTRQVIQYVLDAQQQYQADVVVFPELTLCGYPPEDLLLRKGMEARITAALSRLAQQPFSAMVMVGYPRWLAGAQYNMAGVLHNGQWCAEYAKQQLPNYQVFDEKRYFSAGHSSCIVMLKGIPVGLSICEDIWHEAPLLQTKSSGARLLMNLNASPFHRQKQQQRLNWVSHQAQRAGIPIVYVNQVGGQDELVFDGGSFAVDSHGQCQMQAPLYEEGLFLVQCSTTPDIQLIRHAPVLPVTSSEWETIYQALVLGVRDYVNKNGFHQVILGLSGGIDSALTLIIAVDALGADRVQAVMMPFLYTSTLSRDCALAQVEALGVDYDNMPIDSVYHAFIETLAERFSGLDTDLTEQNLQARCRGMLLMAISNKTGALVLTTGNKSELAVGYSTLYGDMAGGFDVLKDVPKTLVFALANYRNSLGKEVIPQPVIDRPPSAELAPNQTDEDSLPPYDILDQILEGYIEQDLDAETLVQQGFESEVVHKVIRMVDRNEYKRRQSPIGVRISQKGFGRDRRYPITNHWLSGA